MAMLAQAQEIESSQLRRLPAVENAEQAQFTDDSAAGWLASYAPRENGPSGDGSLSMMATDPAQGTGGLGIRTEGVTFGYRPHALVRGQGGVIDSWPDYNYGVAGYDGPEMLSQGKGFFLESCDSAFRINLGGYFMPRYMVNNRKDDGTGANFTDNGFTVPRNRLWIIGNFYEDWTFFMRHDFKGNASRRVGAVDQEVNGLSELDQYWGRYAFSENVGLKVGMFASILNRQMYTSPHLIITTDQPPVATLFDTAIFEGVELQWNVTDCYRTWWIASNGQRSVNRAFTSPENAEVALSHHGELLLAGDWSQLISFTGQPGNDFAAKLGGSLHWEENREIAGRQDTDIFQLAGELSAEGDGWSCFSTIHYWRTNFKSDFPVEDMGFEVLLARYLTRCIEAYGRFDAVYPDSDRVTNSDDFRTITTGLAWYIYPPTSNVKVNVELSYFLDPTTNTLVSPSNSLGLLSSPRGDQFAVTTQLGIVW
jgi:hypothetical protein